MNTFLSDEELFCQLPGDTNSPEGNLSSMKMEFEMLNIFKGSPFPDQIEISYNEESNKKTVLDSRLRSYIRQRFLEMEEWVLNYLNEKKPIRKFPPETIPLSGSFDLDGEPQDYELHYLKEYRYVSSSLEESIIELKKKKDAAEACQKRLQKRFSNFLILLFFLLLLIFCIRGWKWYGSDMLPGLGGDSTNLYFLLKLAWGALLFCATPLSIFMAYAGLNRLAEQWKETGKAWKRTAEKEFTEMFEEKGLAIYRYMRFCQLWNQSLGKTFSSDDNCSVKWTEMQEIAEAYGRLRK